ncbi:TetR family transcriptional regulator [Secundilactobacillus pentosiphilus]|uniref:TetR family transcriptional regulator n=1 Tax=Secundilactobacillus pentosiphilus TaxID=1714682 RepID=A0A1Z5IYB0_9LACO|nr:TetR/AcrR family transcriptional regulator [Secundilactobacillus pentosiphilus]GAX06737.1 TetR family transcriptional regulator [Secundilactobacillus pentosiphilus]
MTKATDASIMSTAIQLFKQSSFDQVTINEICTKCDITKPTFYYHFENKDQLISTYFRTLITRLPQELLATNAGENDLEKIYTFYERTIGVITEMGPDLYSQLYVSNLKRNQHTFDFNDSTDRYVTTLIQQAQKAGIIQNQSEAAELYTNSVLLFEGYEINWCFQSGNFDVVPYFERGLEILFEVERQYQQSRLKGFVLN